MGLRSLSIGTDRITTFAHKDRDAIRSGVAFLRLDPGYEVRSPAEASQKPQREALKESLEEPHETGLFGARPW